MKTRFWTDKYTLVLHSCVYCNIIDNSQDICNFFPLLIPRRGGGREKERKRNIDVREKHQFVASCMCPDKELTINPQPLSLSDDAQPTELHWPGHNSHDIETSWLSVNAWMDKAVGRLHMLGTALPGFRGCNPSWLSLSQSWDHKTLRRQSLSPWQKCHFCPLHPAWPWAWPVSQWRVRILKGGST